MCVCAHARMLMCIVHCKVSKTGRNDELVKHVSDSGYKLVNHL